MAPTLKSHVLESPLWWRFEFRKLGADRFKSLQAGLKEVFCCGHRTWPADHPEQLRGN